MDRADRGGPLQAPRNAPENEKPVRQLDIAPCKGSLEVTEV